MSNKIDRRRKYYMVLDTETCPIDKDVAGVDANNMFTYDLGYAIVDKQGRVYKTASYVVYEIFVGEKALMQSAYYADKIPQYENDLNMGTRQLVRWSTIKKDIANTLKEFNTNIVIAHNARFDDTTMKVTERWLTKSKYRYFLPYGTEVWDTLKMATDTIGKQKSYRAFCEKYGFMTKHKTPRPQLKAEVLYAYMTNNPEFVESHTGLEDVLIEKDIFAKCMAQHKPMRKALYEN